MDYLPVYEDEVGAGAGGRAGAGRHRPRAPAADRAAHRRRSCARRSAASCGSSGGSPIDETRVRHVNVKNAGFVERIFVNYIGQRVRKGDPLFTLFSPELLAAQEEYLLALRTRGALAGTGAGPARRRRRRR